MDIGSKHGYPAGALSNFSPHPFYFDGVFCASMEGFLQALKFKEPHIQVEVCKLVGLAAKRRGKHKKWQREQLLYWKGESFSRTGQPYQDLLDRAYNAMFVGSSSFRRALAASYPATLTHSIGRSNPHETVLTTSEFCSRLTKLRALLVK